MRAKIIRGITYFVAVMMLVSACCLDGESWHIPMIVLCVGAVWMTLIIIANLDWRTNKNGKQF